MELDFILENFALFAQMVVLIIQIRVTELGRSQAVSRKVQRSELKNYPDEAFRFRGHYTLHFVAARLLASICDRVGGLLAASLCSFVNAFIRLSRLLSCR